MRAYLGLSAGLFAMLPAVAHADCLPSFAAGSGTVTITPPATLDGGQMTERFYVQVRNDGETECSLRLAVGRNVVDSDVDFPNYNLLGPNGRIPVVALQAASRNPNVSVDITVPPGGERAIPYDVTLAVGWGSEAGTYVEELVYLLLPLDSADEIANQRTRLSLNIPQAVRVLFAGALGIGGPSSIEMGVLSPTVPTYSPPFAIRVLSTSAYQMQLVSQNAGALVRIGGTERIPYRMTVGSYEANLASSAFSLDAQFHTGSDGDVHPVSVVIDPDPSRHAGDYSDRVTVTVSAI